MRIKKLLALSLTFLLLLGMFPVQASAASLVANGVFNDISWVLLSDGTMTLSGSGALTDFRTVHDSIYNYGPWRDYAGKITNLVIKHGITSLGAGAFANCTNLISVSFPSTLTSLGDYAFYRCRSLINASFPSSLTHIGAYAFSESGLLSISLPSNLTTIKKGAFANTSLTSVTIPTNVTTVSNSLFANCSSLSSVTFEGVPTNIGAKAFYSCDVLSEVTFAGGLSGTIGEDAFAYCPNLQQIDIPVGVTEIHKYAFCGCESLSSVTIPEGVTTIGDSAFRETAVVSITIPSTVKYLGDYIFVFCDELKNITVHTATIEGPSYALAGEGSLEYVHIIGDAPQTESTIFPQTKDTFVIYYDEGTSGWMPPTWQQHRICAWGQDAAPITGSCGKNLTWVLEGSDLTISGSGPMDDYTLKEAPWYAYQSLITNVIIEDGVTTIGDYAFYDCKNMISITIAESVASIGSHSFYNCKGLSELIILNGVTVIEDYAFWWCTGLSTVTMANSVTATGISIFADCEKLETVYLSTGLDQIAASMFQNCRNLEEISLHNGITVIGDRAFTGCYSLSTVILPDSVTTIGSNAFSNSGLTDIVIPASVIELKSFAFYECRSLESVYFKGDLPTIEQYTFKDVTAICRYPAGNETWTQDSMQNYEGTLTWISDDHEHEYIAEVIAPTCYDRGYTLHRCSVCADRYKENYVESLGHDLVEATCTTPKTCQRECCDYTEGDKLDHTWANADAAILTCALCGYSDGKYRLRLDAVVLGGGTSVWIDGIEYAAIIEKDTFYIDLEDSNASTLVVYKYNDPNAADIHTQYPTEMRVYLLTYNNGAYLATYIRQFDNLLQYSGSSIRIAGIKGIRMITSLSKSLKQGLSLDGPADYTLLEYGTALAWASDLEGGKPLTLGKPYTKSNYAYKKGVADPVFKDTGELVQYTNVLVGFNDDQCIPDLAMRPYIIIEAPDGRQITIYGGIIYRSIGYIAYQNRNAFKAGTNAYNYVWSIIHHVYGNQYDADYKG